MDMLPVLTQKQIDELIRYGQGLIETLSNETCLALQELVKYTTIIHGVSFALYALFFLCSLNYVKKTLQIFDHETCWKDKEPLHLFIRGIVSLILSAVCVAYVQTAYEHLDTTVKAYIAPRIFVLEYVTNLINQGN